MNNNRELAQRQCYLCKLLRVYNLDEDSFRKLKHKKLNFYFPLDKKNGLEHRQIQLKFLFISSKKIYKYTLIFL